MHLTGIRLGGVPPFTEPIILRFDERVNVFIGPNASGKSTLLSLIADSWNALKENPAKPITEGELGVYWTKTFDPDRRWEEFFLPVDVDIDERAHNRSVYGVSEVEPLAKNYLGVHNGRNENRPDEIDDPPLFHVGAIRQQMPGLQDLSEHLPWNNPIPFYSIDYANILWEVLQGPFSPYSIAMAYFSAAKVSEKEHSLREVVELANLCCKSICDEVMADAQGRDFTPGYSELESHKYLGIRTNDIIDSNSKESSEKYTSDELGRPLDLETLYLGH